MKTTSDGVFSAPALVPSSDYAVTVQAAGFQDFQQRDITLHVGDSINLSIHLTLASARHTGGCY